MDGIISPNSTQIVSANRQCCLKPPRHSVQKFPFTLITNRVTVTLGPIGRVGMSDVMNRILAALFYLGLGEMGSFAI